MIALPLSVDHAPRLLELGELIFANGLAILGVPFDREQWLAEIWKLLRLPDRAAFVCERNGAIVGVVATIMSPAFYAQAAPRAHIITLWVHPSHRRLGAGEMLINCVTTWARQNGATCIVAGVPLDYSGQEKLGDVSAKADRATRFYEDLDFSPIETIMIKELR